jgi:hypothetical protein
MKQVERKIASIRHKLATTMFAGFDSFASNRG